MKVHSLRKDHDSKCNFFVMFNVLILLTFLEATIGVGNFIKIIFAH